MIRTRFLLVQPSELKFPFELNKVCSCSIQLTNRSDKDVAFKVKTPHPKKYCVRPNLGIVSPGSKCVVEVVMQPQKTAPIGIPRKDKFLVQSRITPAGKKCEDVTSEMFKKEVGNDIQEHKLRVVFVNANPPSPIPEASEEGSSSEFENTDVLSCRNRVSDGQVQASRAAEVFSVFESRCEQEWNETISKLMEEKSMAVRQWSKLQQEWEKMRWQAERSNNGNSTLWLLFLIVVFLGLVMGYIIR